MRRRTLHMGRSCCLCLARMRMLFIFRFVIVPLLTQVKDIKESYVQKVTAYVEEHYTTGDTLKRQIREGILQQVG